MKLTKTDGKLLTFYMQHRVTPLTLRSVLRSFALSWVVLALMAAATTWFIWAGWPAVAWLCIGICLGAFLRDIGRIRLLFRSWPLLHAILNWERVQELHASSEADRVK
jgi:hypothetical protein